MSELESLLYRAFAPVDPPQAMYDRLESTLQRVSDAAADELADWELAAMSDPRNWVRPAAAVVLGGTAAGGLMLMRARSRNAHQRKAARKMGDQLVRQLRRSLTDQR